MKIILQCGVALIIAVTLIFILSLVLYQMMGAEPSWSEMIHCASIAPFPVIAFLCTGEDMKNER
ncbi:hypothetical protein IFU37_023010 (plasmid) [Pantoea agglomerans]|uniref:hypothetical protein n=1 Tax=Enterobacter agglomerans TaxID=549 RepID=UPI00177E7330|nr:hypothetical protein [Pantoea agglomerans]WVL92322.1 hypothetical protein IFU37_023010 [Pantoea agglomerans]